MYILYRIKKSKLHELSAVAIVGLTDKMKISIWTGSLPRNPAYGHALPMALQHLTRCYSTVQEFE